MGKKYNHPIITEHKTGKDGEDILFVDWRLDYAPLKKEEKYRCPRCNEGYLTQFNHHPTNPCKYVLKCQNCHKQTSLIRKLLPFPFSEHQTGKEGNKILRVNWGEEYMQLQEHEKYHCLSCSEKHNKKVLLEPVSNSYSVDNQYKHKFYFKCKNCNKKHQLSLSNRPYSFKYRHDIECPNPNCKEVGIEKNKGWVYEVSKDRCICRYCKIQFNPNTINNNSWQGRLIEKKIPDFNFNSDTWYYKQFYDKCPRRFTIINFSNIKSLWYRKESKHYLLYLLKSRRYKVSTIDGIISSIRKFGRIIASSRLNSKEEITREEIQLLISQNKHLTNQAFNRVLKNLGNFLEFLDLEPTLIRGRDSKKVTDDDPEWLDKIVREDIEQYLDKIPEPIARHYKVQHHTACRPSDICYLPFNCLVKENEKWYINVPLQDKTDRQKLIPANRKIRRVIEQQQQWIREIWGEDFPYLFCHFVGFSSNTYPTFPSLRPLPEPSKTSAAENPMVKTIRILIDQENILDANNQKPHFIGKITRPSRLQEVRVKHGLEAAQLLADHKSPNTTFRNYAPPTKEEKAKVALPFQKLLLNIENKFLAFQSAPESLFENPEAHTIDAEISSRYTVYGYCSLDPKKPCPEELFRQCYGCKSFVASTEKLPLYERQYEREQKRLAEAREAGAGLMELEAKHIIEEMDIWLPELRKIANET